VLRLRGSRDKSSGKGVFPAVPESSPSAPRYEPILLSEQATLYSYTIIHPNPKSGLPPFILAYADFPEEVRVFGRLELPDGERPRIGMRIRTVSAAAPGTEAPASDYLFIPAEETVA
jgi:uncharacterized OB-fold protein